MTTWNRTGTVAVTNGSPTVTGSGVSWSNVQPGDAFHGPDGEIYEVSSVTGSTITLVGNYGGSTASGASYAIQPTRGVLVPLRQQLADLIAQANSILADEPLRAANNLSDLTNAATARTNLGVPLNNIAITGGTINGVAIGGTTPATVINVDNLRLDGNTLSSTDTNGNIVLAPNGTGEVDIAKVDIDGGTIDGVAIGGTTPAPISGTTGSFTGNLTVDTDTLFVDAANNRVGLGTSSPDRRLDVRGDIAQRGDNTRLLSLATDGAVISEQGNGSLTGNPLSYGMTTLGAYPLLFGTNSAERMRIDPSGNLCVGTTSAEGSARLAVVSTSASAAITCRNSTGSGGTLISFVNSGATAFIGSISNSGDTSVSYNTTSDYRLKENAVPLIGAIDRVVKIPVRRFNFIADPDRTMDGFFAHEVQSVVPEAVTGEKDAVDANGWPVYQGIDQSKLVPLLTAALQEAASKIDALEARIAALEVPQ